jgi:hypothetical protein
MSPGHTERGKTLQINSSTHPAIHAPHNPVIPQVLIDRNPSPSFVFEFQAIVQSTIYMSIHPESPLQSQVQAKTLHEASNNTSQ